jgi:hypothetical protein
MTNKNGDSLLTNKDVQITIKDFQTLSRACNAPAQKSRCPRKRKIGDGRPAEAEPAQDDETAVRSLRETPAI